MLPAAIIVFREIIEAGLIVGIMLAVTRTLPDARLWIGAGLAAGVAGSGLVAVFANRLAAAFDGVGQDYFNAAIMAVAAVMLAWHNIWMAGHGREMAASLRRKGEAVSAGQLAPVGLAVVVGVAVLREGAEVVLFLYGVAVSEQANLLSMLGGGLIGLGLGAGFSYLTFLGMTKIPNRHLFAATGLLIAFLAAGMATQAVAFLEQAGAIDLMGWEFLGENAWNSSAVLSEKSLAGRLLHTLVGYSDQPSILQVIIYVLALATIFAATRRAQNNPAQPAFAPAQKQMFQSKWS